MARCMVIFVSVLGVVAAKGLPYPSAPDCGENEVHQDCQPQCQPKCGQPYHCDVSSYVSQCEPGCYCKEGYLIKNNTDGSTSCVKKSQCGYPAPTPAPAGCMQSCSTTPEKVDGCECPAGTTMTRSSEDLDVCVPEDQCKPPTPAPTPEPTPAPTPEPTPEPTTPTTTTTCSPVYEFEDCCEVKCSRNGYPVGPMVSCTETPTKSMCECAEGTIILPSENGFNVCVPAETAECTTTTVTTTPTTTETTTLTTTTPTTTTHCAPVKYEFGSDCRYVCGGYDSRSVTCDTEPKELDTCVCPDDCDSVPFNEGDICVPRDQTVCATTPTEPPVTTLCQPDIYKYDGCHYDCATDCVDTCGELVRTPDCKCQDGEFESTYDGKTVCVPQGEKEQCPPPTEAPTPSPSTTTETTTTEVTTTTTTEASTTTTTPAPTECPNKATVYNCTPQCTWDCKKKALSTSCKAEKCPLEEICGCPEGSVLVPYSGGYAAPGQVCVTKSCPSGGYANPAH
ncbi:unnamed protein product, partial [Mesorhabditis spiculigera]